MCVCRVYSRSRKKMQNVSNLSILTMLIMYMLSALFGYLTFYGKRNTTQKQSRSTLTTDHKYIFREKQTDTLSVSCLEKKTFYYRNSDRNHRKKHKLTKLANNLEDLGVYSHDFDIYFSIFNFSCLCSGKIILFLSFSYPLLTFFSHIFALPFSPFFSSNTDNVEAELLHTFTKVYKFDTMLLLVRLAVLTAVTLTVPIVLFPVSTSSPLRTNIRHKKQQLISLKKRKKKSFVKYQLLYFSITVLFFLCF